MSCELVGLSHFCGRSNIGGLRLIEYAPVNWIIAASYEPIISSAYNWQTQVYFLQNNWLKAYVLPTKRLWTEQQKPNKQGSYYDQKIRLVLPKMQAAINGEFDKMAHQSFMIRLTDANKQTWLLGRPDAGFLFRSNATTGNSSSQLNNYSIEFYASTAKRAFGFVPVI